MNVQSEKLWLIDQISKITDERLIKALKSILEFATPSQSPPATSNDFWDELSPAQKKQIELSIRQLSDGEGIPNEAVLSDFRKQYNRSK